MRGFPINIGARVLGPVQPLSKTTGQPVTALVRTRPPMAFTNPMLDQPLHTLAPVYAPIWENAPMKAQSPQMNELLRQRTEQALRAARFHASPVVTLGGRSSGLDFIRSLKLRPALVGGHLGARVTDVSPDTGHGTLYEHTIMPASVRRRLARAGAAVELGGARPDRMNPAGYSAAPTSTIVSRQAVLMAQGSGSDPAPVADHSFVFMLLAAGFAFMVLRHG